MENILGEIKGPTYVTGQLRTFYVLVLGFVEIAENIRA